MIGGVAWSWDCFQAKAVSFDDVSALHLNVRPEVTVGAGFRIVLFALEARSRGAVRSLGKDGGASRLLDPRGVRRMVAMGMGDQNMRHRLAAYGVQQRLGMRFA